MPKVEESSSVEMVYECGDIPSDESLSVSFEASAPMQCTSARGSTSSLDSIFTGLGRESDLKQKYPEFHRQVTAQRVCSVSPRTGMIVDVAAELQTDTSEGRLLRDALEMCRQLKRTERALREKEKDFDVLQTQNRQIRETYVKIYAKAEQEEEYISNILLKRIQKLKNDKETLAQKYEQEEECLTNDLMKKIQQLQADRDSLEGKMKTEQSALIDNLIMTIRRMETEMANSRKHMDKMRKEKIDQENQLENEQELLFNTLGKQMDTLNNEKRKLQHALQKAVDQGYVIEEDGSAPPPPAVSPCEYLPMERSPSSVTDAAQIRHLHNELSKYKNQLRHKDIIIGELNGKMDKKDRTIRSLEARAAVDERNNQLLHELFEKRQKELEALEKGSMDPPSLPPSHDKDTDIDETSSRSSMHSDMN